MTVFNIKDQDAYMRLEFESLAQFDQDDTTQQELTKFIESRRKARKLILAIDNQEYSVRPWTLVGHIRKALAQ